MAGVKIGTFYFILFILLLFLNWHVLDGNLAILSKAVNMHMTHNSFLYLSPRYIQRTCISVFIVVAFVMMKLEINQIYVNRRKIKCSMTIQQNPVKLDAFEGSTSQI